MRMVSKTSILLVIHSTLKNGIRQIFKNFNLKKVSCWEATAHSLDNALGQNLTAFVHPLFPLLRAITSLGWFT